MKKKIVFIVFSSFARVGLVCDNFCGYQKFLWKTVCRRSHFIILQKIFTGKYQRLSRGFVHLYFSSFVRHSVFN